ncbi:hypothetical protein KJ785_00590 [Patescibacteria group bacterium]|nr:hypothetical protein [Patescibacteria group bacterium]
MMAINPDFYPAGIDSVRYPKKEDLAEVLANNFSKDIKTEDLLDLSDDTRLNNAKEITKVLDNNKDFLFFTSKYGDLLIYRDGEKIKYFNAHDFILQNDEVSNLRDLEKILESYGGNSKSIKTTMAKFKISKLLTPPLPSEILH